MKQLRVHSDPSGGTHGNYFHYLHHRLFTVNFGVELFQLDWWFGTQHDGSAASLARIRARKTA